MSVSVRTLDRKIIQDAANWAMLQAYLNQRGVHVFRTLRTISVSFDDDVTAGEFERFIVNARNKKRITKPETNACV